MRKLIIVALMALVPATSFAITPGDVIGSIFEFILDHIQKKPNGDVDTNAKVILKTNGNRIILGRVFLEKGTGDDTDTLNLPNCGKNTANQRVDQLRLRVAEANVYLDNVRITFNNGTSANINVDDTFAKKTNSNWVNIGNNRCIRKIRATGHAVGGGAKVKYSAVTFVGRLDK